MIRTGLRYLIIMAVTGSMLVLGMLCWLHWRPKPAWDVAIGPQSWRLHLDGVQLVRVITHPLAIQALHGHRVPSPFGHLDLQQQGDSLLVHCAPCTLRARQFQQTTLHLDHLDLRIRRRNQQLEGNLASGKVNIPLRGILTDTGIRLTGTLPATPAQDLLTVIERDVPEASRARVEGSIAASFTVALPSGDWQLSPVLRIERVAGLGTEALSGPLPVPTCARPTAAGFGRQISRAVIAAEDQRFSSHLGYDPVELAAALSPTPAQRDSLRGASTLDEQVARMLFTGASRSPVRKLRELLYAVEMDRTLGKAQIMRLYLSLAPWGEGVCGAEAAARHYFGKPSRHLTAAEAAWLASLLRNPDLARTAPDRVREHARWVVKNMRGIGPRERRLADRQLNPGRIAGLP